MIAAAFGAWFLSERDAPPPSRPIVAKQVATESIAPNPAQPQHIDTPADPQAEAALEEKLRQAAEYTVFFQRLRALYPEDWAQAVRLGAAAHMQDREDAADLFIGEAMRQLRQTRGRAGAKAGEQALDHLFDLHLAVLRELSGGEAALCVDFLNGAPAERFTAFTASHRDLIAAEALAGLDAIDDGSRKKIDREAPNGADFDDLEKALRVKGLDKPAIELLLDAKTPNPPFSDAQACNNGVTYLETLKNLPDLQRLRLYALALEVMAQE